MSKTFSSTFELLNFTLLITSSFWKESQIPRKEMFYAQTFTGIFSFLFLFLLNCAKRERWRCIFKWNLEKMWKFYFYLKETFYYVWNTDVQRLGGLSFWAPSLKIEINPKIGYPTLELLQHEKTPYEQFWKKKH